MQVPLSAHLEVSVDHRAVGESDQKVLGSRLNRFDRNIAAAFQSVSP
jgi:hypothetical protein